MKLSIVIPAYNEEDRIGRMLDAYLPYFSGLYGAEVEFIVSINGSTDKTEEVVKSRSAGYPSLHHIVDNKPIGKGAALIRAFQKTQGEMIGFVDADGSTPPEAFEDLIKNMGDNDVIIASRWHRDSKVEPRQPLSRRIASRVLNILTRLIFGLRLTDTQCGAKLMKKEPLMKILPSLGTTQWAFDVDLLFLFRRNGYRIAEIPTTWHDVAGSKLKIARASIDMLAALTRLRLIYSPFKWVVKFYNPKFTPFLSRHDT